MNRVAVATAVLFAVNVTVHAFSQTGDVSIHLSGLQKGNVVQLTWTASMPGEHYYIIQKKVDQHYYTIDSVKLSGQTGQALTYTEPYASKGVNKYRIRKAGCRKTEQVSNEIAVDFITNERITLSSMSGSRLVTAFHSPGGSQDEIVVVNARHQLVANIRVKPQKTFTTVDFAGLSGGLYHIGWRSGSDYIYQQHVNQ